MGSGRYSIVSVTDKELTKPPRSDCTSDGDSAHGGKLERLAAALGNAVVARFAGRAEEVAEEADGVGQFEVAVGVRVAAPEDRRRGIWGKSDDGGIKGSPIVITFYRR